MTKKKRLPELLKTRRHHNNKGYVAIKTGRVVTQLKEIAIRLGLRYYEAK